MAIVAKRKDGTIVAKDEEIISFRGETFIFQEADQRGRNRVYVTHKTEGYSAEYFPSVFDLTLDEIDAG